mmetsp:Transcript_8767/g.23543  ORF Transcript_8767/g.23543 Transcript_8767/m.23543 type:complete len:262 (+) Transcript_8767:245-1030(+)
MGSAQVWHQPHTPCPLPHGIPVRHPPPCPLPHGISVRHPLLCLLAHGIGQTTTAAPIGSWHRPKISCRAHQLMALAKYQLLCPLAHGISVRHPLLCLLAHGIGQTTTAAPTSSRHRPRIFCCTQHLNSMFAERNLRPYSARTRRPHLLFNSPSPWPHPQPLLLLALELLGWCYACLPLGASMHAHKGGAIGGPWPPPQPRCTCAPPGTVDLAGGMQLACSRLYNQPLAERGAPRASESGPARRSVPLALPGPPPSADPTSS